MTSATETLLSRASHLLKGPLTWAMAEPCAGLRDIPGLAVVNSFRPDVLALARMGIAATPDWPASAPPTVAVTLPRQVDWACGLMASALHSLPAGGTLLAVARNDRGGKRYAALLEEHFGLLWSDSKNRCRAVAVERPKDLPAIVGDWRKNYAPKTVEGTGLLALPGTFSCDHVDKASALLASLLPPLPGRVADFGAGWGYLSHCLLTSAAPPAQVDLYEADVNALTIAKENLKSWNGKTSFHWHDLLLEPCKPAYDAVVMNPPFHDLQDADPAIGRGFIAAAARALKPGGQLWLVANRQLPYEEVLASSFPTRRAVAEEGGFKVLMGIK